MGAPESKELIQSNTYTMSKFLWPNRLLQRNDGVLLGALIWQQICLESIKFTFESIEAPVIDLRHYVRQRNSKNTQAHCSLDVEEKRKVEEIVSTFLQQILGFCTWSSWVVFNCRRNVHSAALLGSCIWHWYVQHERAFSWRGIWMLNPVLFCWKWLVLHKNVCNGWMSPDVERGILHHQQAIKPYHDYWFPGFN